MQKHKHKQKYWQHRKIIINFTIYYERKPEAEIKFSL